LKNAGVKAPLIGCVADDFTGAGDVASFIAAEGADCLLVNGIPESGSDLAEGHDAIVVALKSRSNPAEEAVRDTEAVFDWLLASGIKTLYFKYCSTFDSTPRGNIGPVLDNLLERYDIPFTILCPALPVNKRTVKNGILYVNGVPLSESPMRYHPLNPMWDSDITVLMNAQSKYPSYKMTYDMYGLPDEDIKTIIEGWKKESKHFYIVADFFESEHAQRIAELFSGITLLSGGSALPGYLFKLLNGEKDSEKQPASHTGKGKKSTTLILAGSCSQMTLLQIKNYLQSGREAYQVFPEKLLAGEIDADSIWRFVENAKTDSVLIYSSQAPNEIAAMAKYSQQEVSDALECLMGELGRRAVDAGLNKVIVAGGETSGAVMKAFNEIAYEIGPSVAPGVPVLIPLHKQEMRLVLKSGNFGQEDFFIKTMSILQQEDEIHG